MFYNDRSLSGRRDSLSLSSIWSEGTKSFGSMYTTPVGRSGTKLGFNYSANSVHILDGDLEDMQVRGPASEITRPDGVNIVTSDVTKIYAEKIIGDAAVNIFDKFNMSANNIVNMYFKASADAAVESNNLVNFVNSSGTIKITGAYSGTKVHAEVEDSGQTVKVQLTPKADIEINGNVISEEGIVKITSAANNIIIQGGYAKYELIINADMQNTINQMQQNWQKQGGPALSDAVDTFGIAYRIV